jgi:predicted N-acetyltransferase YhbS
VNNILIRELSAEDAEDISKIYAAITQTPVRDDFIRIISEQVNRKEDASFVAELDGRVVGYMISIVISGGFGIKKSTWIANMGVNPSFMGQGIGETMANKIFEFSREKGIKDIYTSVRWDSPDLLSFFKTLGFDRSNFINLRKLLE